MAVRCAKLHRLQVAYPSASDSELVDHLTEDFAKEGWLQKAGTRTNSYKKRWFTLDNRKFMYHEEPLDAYPKGEIFIGLCFVILIIYTFSVFVDPLFSIFGYLVIFPAHLYL